MRRTVFCKNNTRQHCVAVLCILVFTHCSHALYVPCKPGNGPDLSAQTGPGLTITIDISHTHQRMKSFGASDAWSTQYVGLWPDEKREQIARLLFSTELDSDNNPAGIGLSGWRFYLGAGSSRDTDPDTRIRDRWRSADTFLNEDYDGYDWTRLPGQRWFLDKAKQAGVECLTLFTKSPPVNLTKNGLAYCDPAVGQSNLPEKNSDAFAEYLVDVLAYFNDNLGIEFDYVSPFNEPQWDWESGSQEGCRYSNSKISKVVKKLYDEIRDRALNAKILIPEAGSIDYLYGNPRHPAGNQIYEFFDIKSSNYIGDKLAAIVAGHSYFTDTEARDIVPHRRKLKARLDEYEGLSYAQTEYCILGSDGSGFELRGSGRDLGIEPALRMARTIHYDLTMTDAVQWDWWLAVSPFNYKDGLVYIDNNISDGNYYESKMLWGLGNYSRFVRPAMYRVSLKRSDGKGPEQTIDDLMVSAYYNKETENVVIIAVNPTVEDKSFKLRLENLQQPANATSIIPYITCADHDLAAGELLDGEGIKIPQKSIVTLITEIEI